MTRTFRYSKPKIQDLILLTVSESTNEEVTKVTLLYTIKKTLENVKEWIKINLSEDIFYDEFKNKEFKKRIDGKFLLLSSLNASCVMNNDLEQSKLLNNTMNASSTLENSSFKKEDDEILNASEVLNEIKVRFIIADKFIIINNYSSIEFNDAIVELC